VIDPAHPLYGARFVVLGFSSGAGRGEWVRVAFESNHVLLLPRAATNLGGGVPRSLGVKLGVEALRDLLLVAEEAVRSCRPTHTMSGRGSHRGSGARSSRTSPTSCGS
jgi:hypothetical protein